MKLTVAPGSEVIYDGKTFEPGDTITVKKTDETLDAILGTGALLTEEQVQEIAEREKAAEAEKKKQAKVLRENESIPR